MAPTTTRPGTPAAGAGAAPAQRSQGPVRLVAFDLDGTLIQGTVFIWQTLHQAFGTNGARRAAAKRAFFDRQITYKEWFEHDLELLAEAGATRDRVLAALEGIRPTPGAHESLRALRRAGCKLAVLSGSIDLVLERFFGDVAFDEVLINRLQFDSAGRLSGGQHTPFDIDHKGAGLREIARRQGLEPAEVAFVGDNYNDVSAAREAGLAVAFNPRAEALVAEADVVICDADLRAILPHLIPGP